MTRIKITLAGLGGELASYRFQVSDDEAVTAEVIQWLKNENIILSVGDTITIEGNEP